MASPETRPGRPRGDARHQAILDAAIALVSEVGYDRMTMDAVAARAQASKATIYRRWPGKAQLVVEAISHRVAPETGPPADTGSLRGDLLASMRTMCANLSGDDGGLVCGVAAATRSDPELARALGSSELFESKQRLVGTLLERARQRGELSGRRDAGLVLEVAPGVAILRQMRGEPLDDAFVSHLVDDILVPLLTT